MESPGMHEGSEKAPIPGLGHDRPVLITGGAGFIGCNLADRILREGGSVIIYDNLSRPGVERNLEWLCRTAGRRVAVEVADIRDVLAVRKAVAACGRVFHLAAQVAVTTSLEDPFHDLEVNVGGTLNVLEAIRESRRPIPLVFTSTNKVYGGLDDVPLVKRGSRWEPEDPCLREQGIDESQPLAFHSSYGCSKGAADQYVLDYGRIHGVPSVVLRMSCIYGPHQFGTSDQGWVAHFLIRALQRKPLTIYGDGRQVRDILHVEDLVEALLLASATAKDLRGQAFNMGGGPERTTSLLELIQVLEELEGIEPQISFSDWRPGDQRYYVSNTSRFARSTGWSPRIPVDRGLESLHDWISTDVPPVRGSAPPRPGAAVPRALTGSERRIDLA